MGAYDFEKIAAEEDELAREVLISLEKKYAREILMAFKETRAISTGIKILILSVFIIAILSLGLYSNIKNCFRRLRICT